MEIRNNMLISIEVADIINGKFTVPENDILKIGLWTFVVEFRDGCFEIREIHTGKRDYLKCSVANHVGNIIGNVYRNPELLK